MRTPSRCILSLCLGFTLISISPTFAEEETLLLSKDMASVMIEDSLIASEVEAISQDESYLATPTEEEIPAFNESDLFLAMEKEQPKD